MKGTEMYTKSFKIGLQSSLEYRFDYILGIIGTIIPTIVQFFLWTAMFESSKNQSLYGYTYSSIIMYTILAGIVSSLVACGVEWEIASDIRDGGLNKYIVKPIGYFRHRVCCFFGQKSIQLIIFSLILAIILIIAKSASFFSAEPIRICYFVVAIILAIIINMFLWFIASIVAFWITEAWAAFLILSLVINAASGGVFPLDIFGETVVNILRFLPFEYTIYFPINIINGGISTEKILPMLVIQLVWVVLLTFLLQVFWKIGLKKYEAVGG